MMVIHFNDPPTQAGALHIIFLKLRQGIINFYQFCAVGKNLKAQFNEKEIPMQFILYPITSNSHNECYAHTHNYTLYMYISA